MGLYSHLMFSLFVATLMIILPTYTSNSQFIRNSCKRADPEDVDFCVQFLQLDPRSQNGNLTDLLRISVELAHKRIVETQSTIKVLRKNPKFDNWIKNGLDGCLEMYSIAESQYKDALNYLKVNAYYSLQGHLDSALDIPLDCENGFFEWKNETSPMTEINNRLFLSCKISRSLSLLVINGTNT